MTYSELTSNCDGVAVINRNTLDSLFRRQRVRRVQRGGGFESCALIDYGSLPERYRVRYVDKYGDPLKRIKKQALKSSLKIDAKARVFFERYKYYKTGELTTLSKDLIEEYTINASVLNALIEIVNDRKMNIRALNGVVMGIWSTILGTCEELRDNYGHTLPASVSRLKDKIKFYREYGYESIISKKVGNSNTLKITEDAGKQIIALRRSSVPVYTEAQIFVRFNEIASERGWKTLKSVQSLHQFLNSPEVEPLWWDAVHGEMSSHQRYSRKNKTLLPSYRDSLWYGDGTKLNLFYKEYGDGGAIVVKTMQVYEVIDAFSEVMLGYYISKTENFEAQHNAYRMAIQMANHKPYEIVYDNQGGHKRDEAKELFRKICMVHRPTAPYSGQSKTIESLFARFQAQVLHQDWRFTGGNITDVRVSSRPNLERIEANKDKLYTLSELKVAYSRARCQWNDMRHPASGISRIEMYNNSVNPASHEVTIYDMIDMFWILKPRPSTYTDLGITIVVNKKKYQYEVFSEPGVPDYEWNRRNIGQQYYVMYDLYDFATIRLYKKDKAGKLHYERSAEPYIIVQRNIQEQKRGDMEFIQRNVMANKNERMELQAKVRAIEEAHGVSMEQQGLHRPRLKGMSKKNEITEREIAHRKRKYMQDPDKFSVGVISKQLSNITYNELCGNEIAYDYKKVAEKI